MMPTAPPRAGAKRPLEETVEHVHDFTVPAAPSRLRPVAEEPAAGLLHRILPAARPSLHTNHPRVALSSRCPRGRPD
jgi:hypothetical protein